MNSRLEKYPLSWQSIKPKLQELSPADLLKVIADLYRLSKDNQHFLHARYGDTAASLAPYKEIIRHAVFPKFENDQDLHLSEGRKAIRDYKKAVGDTKNVLELMVYYIECGNDCTLAYGDFDAAFYDSLCSMFSAVVNLLKMPENAALMPIFKTRLEFIVRKSEGLGWGYHDYIADLMDELQ